MEQDTSTLPQPNDDVTQTGHEVPSAPPVFDPRQTEAPLLLVQAIERLEQVSRQVLDTGRTVELNQDQLGRGIDEFTRFIAELVEEISALKLMFSKTSRTMDAALEEMRRANHRVTELEGAFGRLAEDQRDLTRRVEELERWQREHRCNGFAT
jgi:chromosome segregation ATPase